MRIKRLLRQAVISLLAAGPAGGFLFGVFCASDPDPNPIGRVFLGVLMAVLTPLHGGFPPQNEGGTGPAFNAWPQIAIAGLLVFAGLVYRDWRKSRHG